MKTVVDDNFRRGYAAGRLFGSVLTAMELWAAIEETQKKELRPEHAAMLSLACDIIREHLNKTMDNAPELK